MTTPPQQATEAIRWKMFLPAPPERVFALLNSDAGRAAFWAESAVEKDGEIEFHFSNGYSYMARILERRPNRCFSLEYLGGTATFDLFQVGADSTDLVLTHSGVAASMWNEVHAGWLNVLFPLKAWVAYGVDLRNHDSDRSWDQGYADG